MNPKQAKFAREYLVDQNATQAAIRAGYSAKTAHAQGGRLLNHVKVAAYIAEHSEKQAKKVGVTAERVLGEIAKVAFGDIRGMYDSEGRLLLPDQWDDDTAAAVAGLDVVTVSAGEGAIEHIAKIRRNDKLKALDMLAKHAGLYTETLEITGKDGGPIEVTDMSDRDIAKRIAFAMAQGMNANSPSVDTLLELEIS